MKKIMMLSFLFMMHSWVNGMESKDNSKEFHAREKMAIKNYLQTYQRNPYESRCSDKLLKFKIRRRIQSGTLIMNAEGCLVEPPNYRNPSRNIIKYMQADNDLKSNHEPRHQRPKRLSSEEVQKILDKINGEK